MRIMYLTQWFEPEPNIVKGTGFVRALEAAGHDVTVVTGFPNSPSGRIYPGYRIRPLAREQIDGVRVVRLPLYPSHDNSSLRRSLNFLSFFVSALLYCLFRRARYDLAYVYHPPITVGLAAALAAMVRRLPFVLDVQDLWPDTLAATGMRGAARLTGVLGALCRFVYRRAAGIIVQSEGMRRALTERGVPVEKITTIRNWADVEDPQPSETKPNARCTIVYGGNLGRAQALTGVVDAAALLDRAGTECDILLYGDGVEAAALKARAEASAVCSLQFRGRVPQEEIVRVFARADALLLHLGDDPLFAITIPSKTQFYLAMGRPIVAGVAGEAAALLRESGAALVVPPGDAAALAQAIRVMAAMPRAQREAMGESGRLYYQSRFAFERGIAETLAAMNRAAAAGH
jgi:glycosyltransferase involved in cell wall biosynthesis